MRGSAPRIKKSKIQSDCVTQSVFVFVTKKFSLGEPSKKNVTKSGKTPKGGEGSAQKIKKSKFRNLDFLIRGGGSLYCHTRLHLGFSAKLRIWQVSGASCIQDVK